MDILSEPLVNYVILFSLLIFFFQNRAALVYMLLLLHVIQ